MLDVAPDAAERRATWLSDALEPKNVIFAICLAIGVGHYGWAGLGWAAICITFAAVLPILFIVRVVKRQGGGWAQRHLSVVQLRLAVIPVILMMVLVGVGLLVWWGAPREMVALQVAMFATLLAVDLVTRVWEWKISGHTSVFLGAVVMAAVAFGALWLLAVPAVVPIAWARVRLREHTLAQTVAGAVLGLLVAGSIFGWLR
jgi:hypothetical protein